jgi:hypothetical protein
MGTSKFEFISLCYYVVVNEKDGGEIGPTSPDPSESQRVYGGWYAVYAVLGSMTSLLRNVYFHYIITTCSLPPVTRCNMTKN